MQGNSTRGTWEILNFSRGYFFVGQTDRSRLRMRLGCVQEVGRDHSTEEVDEQNT